LATLPALAPPAPLTTAKRCGEPAPCPAGRVRCKRSVPAAPPPVNAAGARFFHAPFQLAAGAV